MTAYDCAIRIDPRANEVSSYPRFPLIPTYIDVVVEVGRHVRSVLARQATLDDILEHRAFASLAESSFGEDWDSPEDSIYDEL